MNKNSIILKNNESISYYDVNKGSKVIVAIHGNFSSSTYYQKLLNNVEEGYRVIAPDLRGYGDSSYHQAIETLKDFANDIKLLLEKLGIDRCHVIGWSLGGGVAMEFAANYPSMVNSLILISSTTHKGYPIFKKDDKNQMIIGSLYNSKEEMALDPVQVLPLLTTLNQNNFDMLKYIFDVTIYTGKHKPSDEQSKVLINESLKQVNLVDADWALTTLNMSDTLSYYGLGDGSIKNISAPTLHIWGTKDITVPAYMIEENFHAIKNSHKLVYDGCGHSPFIDESHFISDLFEFIRKY